MLLEKLKHSMLIAFILYLGKVLAFGMSVQEAVFLIVLVAFQGYREYIIHKERELKSKEDEEILRQLRNAQEHIKALEANFAQINQNLGIKGALRR